MINRKNLSQIKCIVAQVDGVLTDGKFWLNNEGLKQRKFSVRDSMAIRRLIKAGYGFAVVLSSIPSTDEKGIFEHFGQLGVKNFLRNRDGKVEFSALFAALDIEPNECAIIRSTPIVLENNFGLDVSVAGAPQEVRTSVEFIVGSEGGEGALADFAQFVLNHGSYSTPQMTARKAANT